MTADIEKRLKEHNANKTTSTRKRGPWSVVYTESALDKTSAWKREKQIKSYKGGEAFKKLTHGEIA